jgi:paraquat-inducible protein A
MGSGRLLALSAILTAAALLLGLGLVGPCMTIQPHFGEYHGWVKLLRPEMTEPSTYSILTGLVQMHRTGHTAIALLLLGFSVIFPILKLAAMARAAAALALGHPLGRSARFTHHLGKLSMLDVLVIGLFILAAKGLPGGSEVTLGWAVWSFAISVLLSIAASALLHRTRPAKQ